MAINAYGAIALTGGTLGALDSIDGADLVDHDLAFVIVDGSPPILYCYHLDATSGAVESSPNIISPDDNAGTKRWLLTNGIFTSLKVETDPVDADGIGDRGFNDARYLLESNNLSDLDDAATARTNLGLGTIATQAYDAVNIDGGTIDDADYVKAGGVTSGTDGYVMLTSTGGTRRLLFKAADAGNFIEIGSDSDHDFMIMRNNTQKLDIRSASVRFTNPIEPLVDDSIDVGSLTKRWDDIYATNGTIQTSDGAKKDEVADTKLGLDFVMALSPKQFKWKDRDVSDVMSKDGETVLLPAHRKTFIRKHHGLVAQDVEQVLSDQGIATNDFAGFIKDSETGTQGLRYHEFIAPMIKAIQELSAKNDALEARIEELEK